MASAYLNRTPSSAGNRKTWTYSAWFKIGNVSTGAKRLFTSYDGSTVSNQSTISLGGGGTDHTMQIYNAPSGSATINLITNRLFRDCNAWYHIVVAVDTTQSTGSNRVKLYINGVQETSFSTETYGSQNEDFFINSTNLHTIGRRQDNSQYFDGQMAHVNFIDGLQLTPTSFGQTDATTGIWKPKTAPSVTYGTNGFFLKFDNSGNMGLDSAGSNNLTTSGTIIQQKDTPSNVYATLNPLALGPNSVLSNVSNTCAMNAAAQFGAYSTLGVNSGKWYMEMKYSARTHSYDRVMLGIAGNPNELRRTPAYVGQATDPTSYGYYVDGNRYQNDNATTYGSSYTVGDIIGIALDLENNRLFFSKNGTWQDSGDPTSSTGAISITAPSSTVEGSYFFAVSDTTGSYGGTIQCNFGNGYFGTTAITSAGSNGNGSLFEYDVPTGYYALNTKNLGTQS
jgi:hypothetical protein